MSENVKFVCEHVDGLKFYMDGEKEGPFGKGALVNEDGEIYNEEWHNRLLDLVFAETASSLANLSEDANDDEAGASVADAFERATNKFARGEYVS
jgi:hypothetical protein